MAADFVACTVASRRFLAQARVLADSFLEHHPAGRLAVLVPDDPERERAVDPRVEELRPADIGVDRAELHRMALGFTLGGLACALKGRLVKHFVSRGETAVLLDSDLRVYGDLTPLADLARREGLVLTPHYTTPRPTPEGFPTMPGWAPRRLNAFGPDQMILLAGVYNSGVLAADPAAIPFLDWWNERTARYCILEPSRGLFQEQGWTALAPTLFDCHLQREPGWNVSGYQLNEEDIVWEGERPLVGGAPIRCFHFITFDPAQPELLSRFEHIRGVWPPSEERPGATRMCREYGAKVMAAGYEEALEDVSPYEQLADGTKLDPNMRIAYLEALLEHEAGQGDEPPNPLEDGDAEGFLRWLSDPWPGPDGFPDVSRYLVGFHTRFDWVYGQFKEVPGRHAERYLAWIWEATERGDIDLPARWVPPPPVRPADPAIAKLEDQYRDLLATLEAERRSLSWRVTAPLRRVARLGRRRSDDG